MQIIKSTVKKIKQLLFNFYYIPTIACIILILELVLNTFVIWKIRYTEIDWGAYMSEVEGFINGTLDYYKLEGDTGPLVYPAGFVYFFSFLYFITNRGKDIRCAQYIFFALYLLTLYLLYRIYNATRSVPPYALLISCCISYRIHSIFLLRLFNDPVAVALFYLSLNLFIADKWSLGSMVYSLAVSVKMNILLYSPALLMAYLIILGMKQTIKQLFICAFIQFLLGLPFLLVNFVAYINRSFDVGRVFLYKWTVNWRFVPETVFANSIFHVFLLCIHLTLIIAFALKWNKYLSDYSVMHRLENVTKSHTKQSYQYKNRRAYKKNQLLVLSLFTCNFIGIVCSRSLHYQFYAWYYHTLPFLLWSTNLNSIIRVILLIVIEVCWNVYPSTNLSSVSLLFCHILIMYKLYRSEILL